MLKVYYLMDNAFWTDSLFGTGGGELSYEHYPVHFRPTYLFGRENSLLNTMHFGLTHLLGKVNYSILGQLYYMSDGGGGLPNHTMQFVWADRLGISLTIKIGYSLLHFLVSLTKTPTSPQ